MTSFDRFERSVPELMTELAPTRVPDYFDSMLRETAKHRQRPAWSYLERWLPVDAFAQSARIPSVRWRPIILVALLAALIVTGALLYAGSRQTRLPPPFGPARNGTILFSTADGDIVAADPLSGQTRPIVTSPQREEGASFSPDGQRILFARADEGMLVANADGSGSHRILSPGDGLMDMVAWSQDGRRIVATGTNPSGEPTTLLVDPDSGATTVLHLGEPFWFVAGRYGTNELVLASDGEARNNVTRVRYWVAHDDGSGLRQIPSSPDAINSFALASDGSILAYATWGNGDGRGERIHVTDITTGIDRIATPDPGDGYLWQDAFVSPDGSQIVSHAFLFPGSRIVKFRLGLIRTDGTGRPRFIGAIHKPLNGGADVTFSPDGTKLLVTYHDDRSTWLFDVATGEGRQIATRLVASMTWQRLAP